MTVITINPILSIKSGKIVGSMDGGRGTDGMVILYI